MILMHTHLLIYGIVTKLESRLVAMVVLMCWQKQGPVMCIKLISCP
jgi:hypothetical protein